MTFASHPASRSTTLANATYAHPNQIGSRVTARSFVQEGVVDGETFDFLTAAVCGQRYMGRDNVCISQKVAYHCSVVLYTVVRGCVYTMM